MMLAATIRNDTRKLAASNQNASDKPENPINRPPSAGPAIPESAPLTPSIEFACSRRSAGTSTLIDAISAGSNTAPATAATAATTTTRGVLIHPAHSAMATVPLVTTRTPSATSISRRRGNRSTIQPANGAAASVGSTLANATTTTIRFEPVASRAHHNNATRCTPSPRVETIWPPKTRRKSRCSRMRDIIGVL